METTVRVERTSFDWTWDRIVCDECKKVLAMNLKLKGRVKRLDSDKDTVAKYFRVCVGNRGDYCTLHYCRKCFATLATNWMNSDITPENDEAEYEVSQYLGTVVQAELDDDAARKEEDAAKAQKRIECEIDQSIQEEEEMLERIYGSANEL